MSDNIDTTWAKSEGEGSDREDEILTDIKNVMLKHKLLNINVSLPASTYEDE